jgi:hypothetical protein
MIPNKVTEASLMFLVILLVLSPPPLNQPPSTSNNPSHPPTITKIIAKYSTFFTSVSHAAMTTESAFS